MLLNVPTALLLGGTVAVCVAASIGGLFIVRRNVELATLEAHHDVAGFILAVVGVVYAVLLAFVVVIVWQDFDRARADADREATIVLAVYRDAGVLTNPGPDARPALRAYAASVVNSEWDEMARHHRESRQTDDAIDAVWTAFRAIRPRNASETAFYTQAVSSLHDISELRRERISVSGNGLPASLLWVLIIGGVISVGFTYFFGVKNLAAQILMVSALAALIGLVMALIVSLDLPFTGDLAVPPDGMRNALVEFTHTAP